MIHGCRVTTTPRISGRIPSVVVNVYALCPKLTLLVSDNRLFLTSCMREDCSFEVREIDLLERTLRTVLRVEMAAMADMSQVDLCEECSDAILQIVWSDEMQLHVYGLGT